MAERGVLGTEDKYRTRRFEIHGTAAYDIRQSTVRNPRPVQLPEEREQPAVHVRKVRARLHVSPFSVLGIAVTVFLAVLVVFGYVRLYEASTEVADLERQLRDCEAAMGSCGSDYVKLQELTDRQAELEALLEEKTERWMYLSELKERIDAWEAEQKK